MFLVPPRIHPFSFVDKITEGMLAQLMCTSGQGDQPFNITWCRNGIFINKKNTKNNQHNLSLNQINNNNLTSFYDATINIQEFSIHSSILTIHNVTSKHNGNYTCSIKNIAGIDEHTTVLSVAGL